VAEITTVGFDADDTLWESEAYFAVTEERFVALLSPWCASADVATALLATERSNLTHFGYGVKGFVLSMIETAIELTEGAIPGNALAEIIGWGREMMAHPVTLIDGVTEVLDELAGRFRLVVITKGDLFHQESKVAESGLGDRFETVEILSEKDERSYQRVLDRLGVEASAFAMVGNSVRSDIEPVVAIGGHGFHVPHHTTWAIESPTGQLDPDGRWVTLDSVRRVPGQLESLTGSRSGPS
jgi:putative hydrolase of the HAD superfamily